MPRLYLFCSESDKELLESYREFILKFLALATSKALGCEPNGVDLHIIATSSAGSHRVEIEAKVSRGKTPRQDLAEWRTWLKTGLNQLVAAPGSRSFCALFCPSTGIWPSIVDGEYEEVQLTDPGGETD